MLRSFFASLALLVAAAAISASPAGAASNEDRAVQLLAKHRAFVGWQFGDGTFKTMRITGDVTDEKGKKTESFTLLSSGLAYNNTYTAVQRDNVSERTGFTGRVFWRCDVSGFTTPVYGDYAKFLASYTLFEREGTTELPATFVGDKTVDGKPAGEVRVTLQNGDPIDLYIDPDTGAYVKATIDPDGAYETTYHIISYSDVVPGKKMLGSYRVDEGKAVHSYAKFEPNIAVTDDDLHPPAPTASWNFVSDDPVPITLTPERILVDATVNGVKGRFILDTGADAIVMDDRFADRAKAEVLKGSSDAYMMQGSVKTRVRSVANITFGGASLQNVLVYSQDFDRDDSRGLDWQGYAGLMGFDLFAGAIVKLDVYGSKMTILPASADISNASGIALNVDLSGGIPTVPMMLDKTIPVNAMLDTGNPGVVFFGPDLISKHHLRWLGECNNVDSLSIGPIVYEGQAACEWGFQANYVLLGYDFLKHFDFIFDYPHGRVFMTPNKN
ncbi:MAG: aspartyl protease family protein [Candidatus Tumulicola sp.]